MSWNGEFTKLFESPCYKLVMTLTYDAHGKYNSNAHSRLYFPIITWSCYNYHIIQFYFKAQRQGTHEPNNVLTKYVVLTVVRMWYTELTLFADHCFHLIDCLNGEVPRLYHHDILIEYINGVYDVHMYMYRQEMPCLTSRDPRLPPIDATFTTKRCHVYHQEMPRLPPRDATFTINRRHVYH